MIQSERETFVKTNRWHFAKSMPKIPHQYTRLSECNDRNAFLHFVKAIRKDGIVKIFGRTSYRYLILGEWQYWSMDAIDEECDLINRSKVVLDTYDAIASIYDNLDIDVPFDLKALLHGCVGKSVLDIGCGTGRLLDWFPELLQNEYVGIDPSKMMLDELLKKHPNANVYKTSFEEFSLNGNTFHYVLGLFGVGSYINKTCFKTMKNATKANGRYLFMFYDSYPKTYLKTGVAMPYDSIPIDTLKQTFKHVEKRGDFFIATSNRMQ